MKLYPREKWDGTMPIDLGKSKCIFCPEYFEHEYQIYETRHWRVVHNKFPVLWLTNHLMAIPKKHFVFAYEISKEVMAEYPQVEKFIYEYFKGTSYFTFMRESLQNRSLEHIHYHFLPGKMNYQHLEHILLDQGFTNQLDSQL